MTDKEKGIWEEVIERVLIENEPWEDKNKSERYHVVFKNTKMPPKVVLKRANELVDFEYPEILPISASGGVQTNQAIEQFGFKIVEDLSYNKSDLNKLKTHLDKKVNLNQVFSDFISFGSDFLSKLDIEVYKVRMAIEQRGIMSVIVGMRATYSYKEVDGFAEIGFLVSKSFNQLNKLKYNFVYNYEYQGEPEQDFVKIKVKNWDEIDSKLLQEHINQFKLQYDRIKDSKRTQWNVEANTTNNALKYLMFKNENIEKLMNSMNETNLKPYFNLNGVEAYGEKVDKSYKAQSPEAEWFYDTRKKLYYLVELLGERLNEDFKVVYKEKPNGQRGPSLIGFKDYILAGFAPKDESVGDDLFMKVAFSKLKYSPVFDINIDLNFRKKTSPFNDRRDEIFNAHYKEWSLKNNFPDNWTDLIDMIEGDIKKLVKSYRSYLNVNPIKNLKNKNVSLNQILYGPPGTGKTYQTIAKAVSIVTPEYYEANKHSREDLTSKFKELIINNWSDTIGQIAFCTFHQSFSYEDFVEGIKPKVIEEKEIIYEVEKGVFKALCDRARTATNDASDFDTVINKFQNDILEDGEVTLDTNRGKKFDVNYTGQTTFRIRPHESVAEDPQYPASIENIRMLYQGAPLTDLYNPSYTKGILEYLFDHYNLPKYDEVKDNDKPYVIVIDEINRGNVASIFGELITLIEPDKRSGGDEELSVILPYSKKEFSVPNNVYIIGTMNTADRSVEALDSALRRRFSFKEVMPDYNLIKRELAHKNDWQGVQISHILEKINERVTRLIDRDHQIGHSYFLNLKKSQNEEISAKLKTIFSKNIIPLLQEYFFNDFNKIGLVLGEKFLEKVEPQGNIFAKFTEGDGSDYEDTVFEIVDVEKMEDTMFIEAIKDLINE